MNFGVSYRSHWKCSALLRYLLQLPVGTVLYRTRSARGGLIAGSEMEPGIILTSDDSTTVSKVSGLTGIEGSGRILHEDEESRSDVAAIVLCVLFTGLVLLITSLAVVIVARSDGDDSHGSDYYPEYGDEAPSDKESDEPARVETTPLNTWRHSGHTSQSVTSPIPTPAPDTRRPTSTTMPTTMPATMPTTTTTDTTTPPTQPQIRELDGTVGFPALEASLYPPDRFCDYLYYCEILITKVRLKGAVEQTSWQMFQEQAKAYSRVQSGIAFDFRYITAAKLDSARSALDALAQDNIKHYGVLNIIGRLFRLGSFVNGLEDVFEKFKEIQGYDPTRKTIIAIASDYYSRLDFDYYKDLITKTVNNFKVDTVIAVSSTGTTDDLASCSAAPPGALEATQDRFPSLERHSRLVSTSYRYRNPLAMVGLSFELGALVYLLRSDASDLTGIAYAPCVNSGITSQDAICVQDPGSFDATRQSLGPSLQVVGAFLNSATKKDVVISEFNRTVITKFTEAERRFGPFRRNLSWVLFDVHLGDRGGRCGTAPFYILEQFCETFKGPC